MLIEFNYFDEEIMIKANSMLGQLLFTTVRIVANRANGSQSSGTGFFFNFTTGKGQIMPVLVTNKHVVENALSVTFFLHEATLAGEQTEKSFAITLQQNANQWIDHPNGVDLCGLLFVPVLNTISVAMNKKVYWKGFAEDLVPTQEVLERLFPLEEVIMIGSPIGLWD